MATEPRKRRSNGQASRQRILDAAAEIAGERGYEGTSINLVSDRSGLPASSIYWHFKDKDELLAAVIDRSYGRWVETLDQPVDAVEGGDDTFRNEVRRTGAALSAFPDFLRLGLMLILERRPEEPTARVRFLETRGVTAARVAALVTTHFPGVEPPAVGQLVALTMALADGFFIASELGEIGLDEAFDLLATAVLGAAEQLGGR